MGRTKASSLPRQEQVKPPLWGASLRLRLTRKWETCPQSDTNVITTQLLLGWLGRFLESVGVAC